jgi:hypothetical protein
MGLPAAQDGIHCKPMSEGRLYIKDVCYVVLLRWESGACAAAFHG